MVTTWEEEIKEQLFEKGSSDDLRAKILNKPQMSLSETIEVGRSLETIGKHRKTSILDPRPEEVNRISAADGQSKIKLKGKCYRCGKSGHYANDEKCPALGRKCERCGMKGHFKKRCNTKQKKKKEVIGQQRRRRCDVRDSDDSESSETQSDDSEEDSVQYLFSTEPDQGEYVVCTVGSIPIKWVVDSGAGVNVIDRQTWEHLKKKKVRVISQTTAVKQTLTTYSGHSVVVAGKVSAEVATSKRRIVTDIYVAENGSCCLLGRKTAVALGILSIKTGLYAGSDVHGKCSRKIDVMARVPTQQMKTKPSCETTRSGKLHGCSRTDEKYKAP